jgi:hypothetical protein
VLSFVPFSPSVQKQNARKMAVNKRREENEGKERCN